MPDPPLPPPIQLTDPSDGALTAAFVPSAGMIGVSLRDGDDQLLGQRRGLAAYLQHGKTMGLPLLHPWANRLSKDAFTVAGTDVAIAPGAARVRRDPAGLPIHGLLAAEPGWVATSTDHTLTAQLDLSGRQELLASFPFPHALELELSLASRTLRLALTVTATGGVAVPLAFGWHPYLTLPGAARESWRLELPARRRLTLDARGIPTGAAVEEAAWSGALGERELDDAYEAIADGAQFAVSGGGRRIVTTFEQGYGAAQVYAPAGDRLLCFEPMAAPTDALVSGRGLRFAEPGRPATAVFSIAIQRD